MIPNDWMIARVLLVGNFTLWLVHCYAVARVFWVLLRDFKAVLSSTRRLTFFNKLRDLSYRGLAQTVLDELCTNVY